MLTAQQVKDSFERLKGDISDISDTKFLEWLQFAVRFIYDKTKRIDPERYIKSQLFAVTADPQTSNLPTDFENMNQTGCGLFEYNTTDAKPTDRKLGITGYGRTDEGYYLTGSTVVFTGITTKSYYMRYLPVPPTIDALADYISVAATVGTPAIVEDRHLEYLVKAIDVLYEQSDNNPQAESLADFRFVRALGGILDGFNRTPQISTMDNPSNDF